MKAIEVKKLSKWYGSARGVEDLSFSIEKGKIDTVAGDYNKDELPSGYDMVFLSAIIHSNSPEQNHIAYATVEYAGDSDRDAAGVIEAYSSTLSNALPTPGSLS